MVSVKDQNTTRIPKNETKQEDYEIINKDKWWLEIVQIWPDNKQHEKWFKLKTELNLDGPNLDSADEKENHILE